MDLFNDRHLTLDIGRLGSAYVENFTKILISNGYIGEFDRNFPCNEGGLLNMYVHKDSKSFGMQCGVHTNPHREHITLPNALRGMLEDYGIVFNQVKVIDYTCESSEALEKALNLTLAENGNYQLISVFQKMIGRSTSKRYVATFKANL